MPKHADGRLHLMGKPATPAQEAAAIQKIAGEIASGVRCRTCMQPLASAPHIFLSEDGPCPDCGKPTP